MIQCRLLKEIDKASRRTSFGISASEDHPSNPAVNNRSGTHGAGFLGHIQVTVHQAPVSHGFFRLGQGEHLCVSGGIPESLYLIVRPCDDGTVPDDHSAYGDFLR